MAQQGDVRKVSREREVGLGWVNRFEDQLLPSWELKLTVHAMSDFCPDETAAAIRASKKFFEPHFPLPHHAEAPMPLSQTESYGTWVHVPCLRSRHARLPAKGKTR